MSDLQTFENDFVPELSPTHSIVLNMPVLKGFADASGKLPASTPGKLFPRETLMLLGKRCCESANKKKRVIAATDLAWLTPNVSKKARTVLFGPGKIAAKVAELGKLWACPAWLDQTAWAHQGSPTRDGGSSGRT